MFFESALLCFLLILLIMILWFCHVRKMKNTNYQKAFVLIVECLIIATVFKIIATVLAVRIEKFRFATYIFMSAYYVAFMHVWPLVFEISHGIVNQDIKVNRKKLKFLYIPFTVGIFLFAINPFFPLVFELAADGTMKTFPLFQIHNLNAIVFTIPSFYVLLRNRKYLPKSLIKCTIILIVIEIGVEFIELTERADSCVLSMCTIATLIMLFSLLSYEKFWFQGVQMMNKLALYTYLDRCAQLQVRNSIYIVKLLGYQYFDTIEHSERGIELLSKIGSTIQRISPVQNIYYLENGRIAIVIDENDHVEESGFLEYLKHNIENHEEFQKISFTMNFDIYQIHMPEDLKSVSELKEFLRYNQYHMQTRDMEEKVHVYSGEDLMIYKAFRVKKIEEAINRGLRERSFQVYYQPIISMKDGKVHSAEALIRYTDQQMGVLYPDEFIPIAELSGTIQEMGLQVFESVCQFLHNEAIQDLGISFIEVNFSMQQFMDDLLCSKLEEIMEKYELPKNMINIEITETATMYEEQKLRRQMKFMSKKGFEFSLDDYGTGFSNLESVLQYPLKLVKLDKSIIWSSMINEKSMIALQSLITIFHNLSVKIVAEGVEEKEQLQMLNEMKCDYVQGYYYAKPMPREQFLNYVRTVNLTDA